MQQKHKEYDVVIVGAGPAGLSAAIKLAQLASQQHPLKICVLDKGPEVGAHIIPGTVFDPTALSELIPTWQVKKAPIHTAVTRNEFIVLSEKKSIRLSSLLQMKNKGHYLINLGLLTRWMAEQAESLGVEICTGLSVTEVLFDNKGRVSGVKTGEIGLDREGHPKKNHQAGTEIKARYTLLAEGCRGSLTKMISEKYGLQQNKSPQTYGIALKELWEVPAMQHRMGTVTHTIGWPLENQTYGKSFVYHLENNHVAIGLIVGLDYKNPYLDPFQEFQRLKHHPAIQPLLEGGKRIAFSANAVTEGGLQALPKLYFPGGLLIGGSAGFLNVAKIKGTHTAMKSGMLAAEVVFDGLLRSRGSELSYFERKVKESWIWDELKRTRNIRPAFRFGLWPGLLYSALDAYVFRGLAPWTIPSAKPNHTTLQKAAVSKPIEYPKPDGSISFDKLSSVQLSNTHHEENQPNHLKLVNPEIPILVNLALYDAPEQRYCPTQVYEIVRNSLDIPQLQIHAKNCVHCKICDIKDPTQNIQWTPPQGGEGPNYSKI